MFIYCATNLINGKKYYGQTVDTVEQRWAGHISEARAGSTRYFSRSLRKHGHWNFLVEEICQCDSQESLNKMEDLFISIFDTRNSEVGYNLRGGGSNGKLNQSVKDSMSKAAIGKVRGPFTDQHKKRITESLLENKRTGINKRSKKILSPEQKERRKLKNIEYVDNKRARKEALVEEQRKQKEKITEALLSEQFKEEIFSGTIYFVNWPKCTISVDARTFSTLEEACAFAKKFECFEYVRIEEMKHIQTLKRIPKEDWVF